MVGRGETSKGQHVGSRYRQAVSWHQGADRWHDDEVRGFAQQIGIADIRADDVEKEVVLWTSFDLGAEAADVCEVILMAGHGFALLHHRPGVGGVRSRPSCRTGGLPSTAGFM